MILSEIITFADYHVLSFNDVENDEATDHGVILDVEDVAWAEKQMWDNDVVEKDGNRLKAGDPHRFFEASWMHKFNGKYYRLHRDEMVNFVTMRIHDADEAQDIVQNLFLRLLSGHCLTTEVTLPSLVYTMARHLVADYYRRRHVYEEYEHHVKRMEGSDDSMESVFSARQLMERMEFSLARLSEESRQIYRLHIYGGMKVSEIAQELKIDYKRVENRLGQARKAVRRQLKACI